MKKTKVGYVDGFVLVVPKSKVATYKKMARFMARLCKKYGALEYRECMGNDLTPSMGGMKAPTFSTMTKLKKGETVWFSYVTYKSKKHRDQTNARMMKDPSMDDPKWKAMPMPFDMKRMAYGGFTVEVSS
ncbi:MAG: DUF1428 domain-containing protein [Minisyncoccia bacterium]